ncbi:Rieske 2Fe-2S domain-containing protein [Bacteriovoracales bacterium]|nr:Rieske 2Fe-2S domain-containing protein [Bacteriovoracales bacterium]
MPKIEILPDNKSFDIDGDKSLLEGSLKNEVPHVNACGGNGKCSTCRIWLLEGVENCEARNETEEEMAKSLKFGPEIRLACQTKIKGDVKYRRLIIDDADLEITSTSQPIGSEKEVAILFTDIRGFTSFSEKHPPYDVLFILNRHFNQMSKIVETNGGLVDNYVGDSLFAIFGMENEKDAVFYAVKSGVEMLEEVDKMKAYMKAMYGEDFEIGIGIHYGKVVAGEIGRGKKVKKTVIGDNVNLASRIESANKQADTRFLVSEVVYEKVKDDVISDDFVRIKVPGKDKKFTLYEINGLKKKASDNVIQKEGRNYQKVLDLGNLPSNTQKEISLNNKDILLINNNGEVLAIDSRCPHADLPFKDSKINGDCQIECKWHHSFFDIKSGNVTKWCNEEPNEEEKAKEIKVYPIVIEGEDIFISFD